ncbi:MAG: uracil-DNA glycosylase family protein [Clostridium tyrobutyricum]|uniref:hypothetical protein n=1 Tax=Clostridium tyrobutyricum TaxID=1519 RepID=UPI002431BAFC|nr:hypothetical protein [Clostridium tyrobutyricum]MCH4199429.1 uracil-DNA glycosylase family protein [Clostridium tyrobutyricum]MCH4238523.1 uracil-DNA glycosylase family protein [Clostridium tyrobutyricum]MCH4259860.1 uracil-DNA glycosylase family protein [Clostridium tyrobutyricum]MCI1651645.1 uracil-DNA glycosylase family protein [Clostridium tyrobutyricum]MCI1936442.1 uracil-DNA glycosylase family protein [Clostridium tyrobutyricum]
MDVDNIVNKLKKLKELVKDYDKYKRKYIEFVWNRDLDLFIENEKKIRNVKLIIIGENPGNAEKKHEEYFSPAGSSGKILRILLEGYLGKTYNDKVMMFNKIPIYSSSINKLVELREGKESIFNDVEEKCANIIGDITNAFPEEVEVVLMGMSDQRIEFTESGFELKSQENTLFDKFYRVLLDNVENRELNIVPHISYGQFFIHKYIYDFYFKEDIAKHIFEDVVFKSKLNK